MFICLVGSAASCFSAPEDPEAGHLGDTGLRPAHQSTGYARHLARVQPNGPFECRAPGSSNGGTRDGSLFAPLAFSCAHPRSRPRRVHRAPGRHLGRAGVP